MRLPIASRPAPRSQRGAILVVALMFLVLLTIVGVSSISTTTLEEKMAGNARDQQVAFQAAESALRDAEIDLEPLLGNTAPGNRDTPAMKISTTFVTACTAGFTNGVCKSADYRVQLVASWTPTDWNDAQKTVQYGTYTGQALFAPLVGVAQQPRYVIEYMGPPDDASTTPPTRFFRISARGWGANPNSAVTLQSVYKMPMNN